MSKDQTKESVALAKKLLEENIGRVVVTAWRSSYKSKGKSKIWVNTRSWMKVKLGQGVHGTIIGWGADGPRIEVLEKHWGHAAVAEFHPGGTAPDFGEGRTWKFT